MRGLIMAAQQQVARDAGIRPNYIYGLLYNWYAASDERIGNNDFKIPELSEWQDAVDYVNTNYNISPDNFGIWNHFKSCRQVNSPLGGDCDTNVLPRWESNAEYGRNTVNFSALPAGRRTTLSDSFFQINTRFGFWSNTPSGAGIIVIVIDPGQITTFINVPVNGYSLRLQRLATPTELLILEGQIIPDYYKGNNDFLYDCVRINDRIWTVQNLAETHWNDGTPIPFAGANGVDFTGDEWAALTTPGVCAYNNDVNTWGYTL